MVFVRGAVPGDRVRAEIGKSKKSFAEARVVELLEPSPDRVEPVAAHPGAPWQVLPYERQLAEKERQVRDALERLGGFEAPPVEPIMPAVEPLRYRNKVEYSFGEDEDGELVLGFHRPGRWDVVDPVAKDILASERVDEVREAVEAWCREEGLSAYDRRDHAGFLRNLVVREGRRTGTAAGADRDQPGRLPGRRVRGGAARRQRALDPDRGRGRDHVRRQDQEAQGPRGDRGADRDRGHRAALPHLARRLLPDEHRDGRAPVRRSPPSWPGLSGRERVYDLYCGIGTISLALALEAREVVGVELVERAVADAIENAKLNGVDNARFYAGDIRTAMRPLLEEEGKADVVVIDPPRAGLSQKVVRRVLEVEARKIVYVSCNPTTLAPNARQMVDAGYELKTVRPVDMFPQTPHIECVALLERKR